jgi:hypothetical protein
MQRMPPNSTQNLNAKLSLTRVGEQGSGRPAPSFNLPPTHSAVKIVSGASRYRGGYHLNV